ncbi:hypothetical protein ALC60_05785 [Trachymyrmex zeteki]|nr:hypothetical protein ALC60_05785 [Trachymyrmex zeteki]
MSLTLTLSGKNSVLAANYFPAIDLSDGDYEFGLMIFETYHTIPNVNESNNKFYFGKDDAEIIIPKGSYEVRDINEFLKRAILRKRSRRDALDTVDVVRGDAAHSDNNNNGDDEFP